MGWVIHIAKVPEITPLLPKLTCFFNYKNMAISLVDFSLNVVGRDFFFTLGLPCISQEVMDLCSMLITHQTLRKKKDSRFCGASSLAF